MDVAADPLPPDWCRRLDLPATGEALRWIHFPDSLLSAGTFVGNTVNRDGKFPSEMVRDLNQRNQNYV